MADLDLKQASGVSRIVGSDEQYCADVTLDAGIKKLQTAASITVEEILGLYGFADSWFRIEDTGSAGSTITISIAGTTNDPSTPDRDRPDYSKVFTVLAGEVGDEIELRDRIISELNADSNFDAYFTATDVIDNAIIHIESIYHGEFWETSVVNAFDVTTTGTASVTIGYSDFIQRGKTTSLAADPDDKRVGILGISGSVTVTPGEISDRFINHVENATYGRDLRQDGSVTPIDFTIDSEDDKDLFIESLRFHGAASSIKFGQFLSISTLTNGLVVTGQSDGETFSFDAIKTTDDFKNEWNFGQTFELFDQPGLASFTASLTLSTPFPIRATGTFTIDDFVTVTVQDDLDSVSIDELEFQAFGFRRDA